jgi:hypothetical protein
MTSRRRYVWTLLFALGCAPAASSPVSPVATAPPPREEIAKPPAESVAEPATVVAQSPPASAQPTRPQMAYRPDDVRPNHDDAKLAALGIRKYESRRLRLYTDIPEEQARPLPEVIDAAYDAFAEYLGPLPPARDGSEFQMTGYLLNDERVFREAGLIPVDLPTFEHGRHRRNEFWMRNQEFDYYRRHLLIHEAAHCVMLYLPDTHAPVWYLEGMAELFGTHRFTSEGKFEWGVMPDAPENFAGMGRITLVRNDYAAGQAHSIDDVLALRAEDFLAPPPYAWSWALCHFLARHPRYAERFRELARHMQGTAFPAAFAQRFSADARDLAAEWSLFTLNLQYGYDLSRAAMTFAAGQPLPGGELREVAVRADRGWQSSRVLIEAGAEYAVEARGEFTLAELPKPWISQPQGVSIRYFDGLPLGQLLACVHREDGVRDDTLTKVLPIGREKRFAAPVTGTLYLRLNDSWSDLADNHGEVQVTIRRLHAPR